ncbi:uncharacterized protein [Triticum aestivum]|uniref:uncharacterized protein isoform X1 n=1 Tax=Triticum aestivum TaxID=4565 RepID=UPI001D0085CF|nr:uncharacterized protein LOC123112934 isoform X1 [Triticum aestivum]
MIRWAGALVPSTAAQRGTKKKIGAAWTKIGSCTTTSISSRGGGRWQQQKRPEWRKGACRRPKRTAQALRAAQVGGGGHLCGSCAGGRRCWVASKTTRRCRPSVMEPPPVELSPERSRRADAKLASVCARKQGRRKFAAAGQVGGGASGTSSPADPYDGWGTLCPPATGGAGGWGARCPWASGEEEGQISMRFKMIRSF